MFNAPLSTLFLLFGLSAPVYAYLDPGTGSIIIQGIIASIAFGLATMRLWWYKVSSFISFSRKGKEIEAENIDEE
jgi:uncharacterized membrane protein